MKEQEEVNRVRFLLSQWIAAVKLSNAGGYTDINRVSENLAMRLLNTLFDFELENLNWGKVNFHGVDLGCERTKIAFQVTSEFKLNKIKESIDIFYENSKSKSFSAGIRFFLIAEKRLRLTKQKKQQAFWNKYPAFDLDEHIMALPDLMTAIERCYSEDRERFERIKGLLEEEFAYGEEKIGRRTLLQKLFEGSRRYCDDLCGGGGRFRHLNISEILLSPARQQKSQGFIQTPVRLDNEIDESDEKSSANIFEAIPRLWDKDSNHAMLVGEGGMGKTVSIIWLWKNFLDSDCYNPMVPVPIFIPLNEFNETTPDDERKHFIKNMIRKNYLEGTDRKLELRDILSRPLREETSTMPSVILLLDGFNEITVEKQHLLIELREIMEHWKGVQIIISSRFDARFTMNWNDFHLLTLLGLNDASIKKYLDKQKNQLPNSDSNSNNRRLLELLSNPMMLTIYASTCEIQHLHSSNPLFEFKPNVESPGELLWNFIEAQVAKYFRRQGIPEATKHYYRFLLKHLLPAIGYQMESEGRFEFSNKSLRTTIDSYLNNLQIDNFFDAFPDFLDHEEHLPFRDEKNSTNRKQTSDIIDILSNKLFMLVKEGNSYRFLHQNFRDFFAAVHILIQTKISLMNDEFPATLKGDNISPYTLQYIGEIEGEHHCKPYLEPDTGWKVKDNSYTIMARTLDRCRRIFDGSTKWIVRNILEIWKQVRGEWTGLDLSYLDLSNVSINSVRCSRPYYYEKDLVANFNNSLLHERCVYSQGHNHDVWFAAFSPDGKKVLSASADWTVREFGAVDGLLYKILEGHESAVTKAIYNPNGKKILTSSWDKTIKEWDANTGECLRTFRGHLDRVNSAIYSSDGKKILSASEDGTIKVWNTCTGDCCLTLEAGMYSLKCASYSPDGKKILSASITGTIKEWDSNTLACLHTYEGHESSVYNASYRFDGKRFLSSSRDGTVREWDVTTGECIRTYCGHESWVNFASYSPNGKIILSSSDDGTIKAWDAVTGDCLRTLSYHYGSVYSAGFSPDGSRIISASADYTVNLWNASTGEVYRTLKGNEEWLSTAISNIDGEFILSSSCDGTIMEWSTKAGICLGTFIGHQERVNSAVYSFEEEKILSASSDGTIKEWDAFTGECLNTFRGQNEGVLSAVYSPDERRILSVSEDYSIREWDIDTGASRLIVEEKNCKISNGIYNPDGKKILFVLDESIIRMWDVKTRTCIRAIEVQQGRIISVEFNVGGKKILVKLRGGEYREFCVENGKLLNTWNNDDGITELCDQYPDSFDNGLNIRSFTTGFEYLDETFGVNRKIFNFSGLWFQGCSFANLHSESDLSEEDKYLMWMYGARDI